MVIKADLKCKQTDFNLPLCQIEKVVKLTPSEYTEFVSNPLGYYDFLREFNAEKHEYLPDGIPCLLLIREGHKDGFIIDTEGYDYARYTAHIPNAKQLAIAVQYPSLENAVRETAIMADRIVQEAIDCSNKKYSINTDELRNKFRGAGFSEELMYVALKDRPEIESVDFDGGYMLCTVKDEYIQQADSRRTLTQEEADVMLAKHTLWLNDAGGIRSSRVFICANSTYRKPCLKMLSLAETLILAFCVSSSATEQSVSIASVKRAVRLSQASVNMLFFNASYLALKSSVLSLFVMAYTDTPERSAAFLTLPQEIRAARTFSSLIFKVSPPLSSFFFWV